MRHLCALLRNGKALGGAWGRCGCRVKGKLVKRTEVSAQAQEAVQSYRVGGIQRQSPGFLAVTRGSKPLWKCFVAFESKSHNLQPFSGNSPFRNETPMSLRTR